MQNRNPTDGHLNGQTDEGTDGWMDEYINWIDFDVFKILKLTPTMRKMAREGVGGGNKCQTLALLLLTQLPLLLLK